MERMKILLVFWTAAVARMAIRDMIHEETSLGDEQELADRHISVNGA